MYADAATVSAKSESVNEPDVKQNKDMSSVKDWIHGN